MEAGCSVMVEFGRPKVRSANHFMTAGELRWRLQPADTPAIAAGRVDCALALAVPTRYRPEPPLSRGRAIRVPTTPARAKRVPVSRF